MPHTTTSQELDALQACAQALLLLLEALALNADEDSPDAQLALTDRIEAGIDAVRYLIAKSEGRTQFLQTVGQSERFTAWRTSYHQLNEAVRELLGGNNAGVGIIKPGTLSRLQGLRRLLYEGQA